MNERIIPTPDDVHSAVLQARQNAAGDVRWVRAIDKAWTRLLKGGWAWNGSTLVMRSSDGKGQYEVTAHGCQCHAYTMFNVPCLHRAARKLLVNAAGFQSKVEQVVRMSPAEAAIEAQNERAMDADALEYALNKELGRL